MAAIAGDLHFFRSGILAKFSAIVLPGSRHALTRGMLTFLLLVAHDLSFLLVDSFSASIGCLRDS
jgi:hypothetical protein